MELARTFSGGSLIALLSDSGEFLHPLGLFHVEPAADALMQEIVGVPFEPSPVMGARVLATGEAVVIRALPRHDEARMPSVFHAFLTSVEVGTFVLVPLDGPTGGSASPTANSVVSTGAHSGNRADIKRMETDESPDRGAKRPPSLRVLIANERNDRLELLAAVITGLGHEVIAQEIEVSSLGQITARERPDVALVGLGVSSDHALEMIDQIVHESSCPVIAVITAVEPAYIHEAAKRGIFAYIVDAGPDELESALDITLQRFAEYHNLQGAFGRRAVIEQAKGILMAKHGVDADAAFKLLRDHSQSRGHKLADVADAVVESHLLLLTRGPQTHP